MYQPRVGYVVHFQKDGQKYLALVSDVRNIDYSRDDMGYEAPEAEGGGDHKEGWQCKLVAFTPNNLHFTEWCNKGLGENEWSYI